MNIKPDFSLFSFKLEVNSKLPSSQEPILIKKTLVDDFDTIEYRILIKKITCKLLRK